MGKNLATFATRDTFTTGQVAKLCRVATRTASMWIDKGILRGYRVPGTNDRRVTRENLLAFLQEHGMPLRELDGIQPGSTNQTAGATDGQAS